MHSEFLNTQVMYIKLLVSEGQENALSTFSENSTTMSLMGFSNLIFQISHPESVDEKQNFIDKYTLK